MNPDHSRDLMAELLSTYYYNIIRERGDPIVESFETAVSLHEDDASGCGIIRNTFSILYFRFRTVLDHGIVECTKCLLRADPAFAEKILAYPVLGHEFLDARGGYPAEYDAFQRHMTKDVTLCLMVICPDGM